MKRKYLASFALALWLCVVAWVSAMIVAKPSVGQAYSDEDGSAAIAQLQLNINKNQQTLAALDALGGIDDLHSAGLAVSPAPPASTEVNPATGEATAAVVPHQLTLILSADNGRRAVVDGQLVRPGTRLADGSRIRGIGRDHVLLEDNTGERLTLRIPAPFSNTSATGAAAAGVPR